MTMAVYEFISGVNASLETQRVAAVVQHSQLLQPRPPTVDPQATHGGLWVGYVGQKCAAFPRRARIEGS